MVRPLRRAADDGGVIDGPAGRPPARLPAVAVLAVLLTVVPSVTAAGPPDAVARAGPASAAPAADPDVTGDDGADRYVGTGAVLLPGSFGGGERAAAASCAGCRWRLTTTCIRDVDGGCAGTVGLCPPGEEHLRFWLSRPGTGWVRLGAGCMGPGGPVPLDRVADLAVDRFVRDLPTVDPAAQPARGAVVRIPVVFRSGQPRRWSPRSYDVLGFAVTVRADPLWNWRFDDGASLRTRSPGARWPVADVAHGYSDAGVYDVRLTTRWTAEFTVDGLGPFPVDEPVSQQAQLAVRVGEGRAVLVD